MILEQISFLRSDYFKILPLIFEKHSIRYHHTRFHSVLKETSKVLEKYHCIDLTTIILPNKNIKEKY